MRAQAHTLEAVAAGLVLLGSLVFALQATAVTPLTASTSSQHIENQQQASASGVLDAAADEGELKRAVLYWNDADARFHGSAAHDPVGYFTSTDGIDEFALGRRLLRTYDGRGIALNVRLSYQTATGGVRSKRLIYRGGPSDNAVSATEQIALYDGDRLHDPDEEPTGSQLSSSSSFYAPDVDDGALYNVVRLEVVVWRM